MRPMPVLAPAGFAEPTIATGSMKPGTIWM
jgi:hypothetical protein